MIQENLNGIILTKKKIFLVENVRYTTVLDTKKIDTNINKNNFIKIF